MAATPLPPGADSADGFLPERLDHPHPDDERIVRGPVHTLTGGAHTYAICWQRADGAIIAEGEQAPSVLASDHVGCHWDIEFTPVEAREFAKAMIAAADLAEGWAQSG